MILTIRKGKVPNCLTRWNVSFPKESRLGWVGLVAVKGAVNPSQAGAQATRTKVPSLNGSPLPPPSPL